MELAGYQTKSLQMVAPVYGTVQDAAGGRQAKLGSRRWQAIQLRAHLAAGLSRNSTEDWFVPMASVTSLP